MSGAPLVSILIPAYNERFFAEALAGARAQAYEAIEIVVCDDSPGTAIEGAVRSAGDARIRYFRNPQRLGFHGNFTRCLELARGEFVKFLNDDDRLAPMCVPALVAGFQFDPRVRLATSRRAVIDETGARRADIGPTTPLAHVSCLVPGIELGDFCLINGLNLIGEPSTVLFRRRDIAPEPGGLFSWDGFAYHVLADLSLWLRLLAHGAAFYQAAVLSEFRMHAAQEQTGGAMDVESVTERGRLIEAARRAGFLAQPSLYRAAAAQVEARARRESGRADLEQRHADELRGLMQRLADPR